MNRQTPPSVPDAAWAINAIDRFVLAKLDAKGLKPSPRADRRTLLRRLAFDLSGLPPTPATVDAFLSDVRPGAYERLVDRLLADPRHGERWARHWLDVARYGESDGFERDMPRFNAWPYRDWVVRAFNADLPYDEFARLQLAGDRLRPGDADALAATGFLVAGPHDIVVPVGDAMKAAMRQDELEDIVGTVGAGVPRLDRSTARGVTTTSSTRSRRETITASPPPSPASVTATPTATSPEAQGRLNAVRTRLQSLRQDLAVLEEPVRRTLRPTTPAVDLRPLAEWDFTRSADGRRVAR